VALHTILIFSISIGLNGIENEYPKRLNSLLIFTTKLLVTYMQIVLCKMKIWQEFNFVNQSFLHDWQILYWRML